MWLAPLCLLLLGCGPVLLGEEARPQDPGTSSDAGSQPDPSSGRDAASSPGASSEPGLSPAVAVRIKPLDCGKCFELQAEGSGGQAPYGYEWEDGSVLAQRRVCADAAGVALTVVAVDAASSRSAPQTIHLQGDVDADCLPVTATIDAGPAPTLCLDNPSFEGTPALNMGQDMGFDAPPWSTCTNPLSDNTPDIGNETLALTPDVPKPQDGVTFLALGEGEQVSQTLCSQALVGAPLNLELDLARVDVNGGLVPETEQVFLQIWGGLSADCSQRELLWMSPALQAGWQRFCATFTPQSFMTQLTLRANADMTLATPAYLLVDNLKPVDSCP